MAHWLCTNKCNTKPQTIHFMKLPWAMWITRKSLFQSKHKHNCGDSASGDWYSNAKTIHRKYIDKENNIGKHYKCGWILNSILCNDNCLYFIQLLFLFRVLYIALIFYLSFAMAIFFFFSVFVDTIQFAGAIAKELHQNFNGK